MTSAMPTWLTTKNDSQSPFRADTRKHLLARHQKDPRVGELVTRLQAKGEVEGAKERDWAQRICRGGHRLMSDLHKTFSPADEDDVLRLAAYMADYSFSQFFVEYNNPPMGASPEALQQRNAQYAELIQRITPIIADLQPAVAIGHAQEIHATYAALGKTDELEAMYLKIAQEKPQAVMGNYRRLKQFGNYETLLEVAQAGVDALAITSNENKLFADQVRAQRAVEAKGYGRQ